MNKLILKNPIQRFKMGKQIVKANGGTGHGFWREVTRQNGSRSNVFFPPDYTMNIGGKKLGFYKTSDDLTAAGLKQGWYDSSGNPYTFVSKPTPKSDIAGSITKQDIAKKAPISFKTAFNNARNAGQETFNWRGQSYNTRNKGEENYVFQNGKWVDPNKTLIDRATKDFNSTFEKNKDLLTSNETDDSVITIRHNGFSYNLPKTIFSQNNTLKLQNSNPDYQYNGANIRANRGMYSNVDQFYDWMNGNRDSDEYKLFANINDGMIDKNGVINRDLYNQFMSASGISGNLGKRDSRRLAELLNTLRGIGTEGSDIRKSYDSGFNSVFNGTQTGAYNRSGIRNLMYNSGLNPYDYSGEQRRALRLYLNGESNDTSLLTNGLEKFIVKPKPNITREQAFNLFNYPNRFGQQAIDYSQFDWNRKRQQLKNFNLADLSKYFNVQQ